VLYQRESDCLLTGEFESINFALHRVPGVQATPCLFSIIHIDRAHFRTLSLFACFPRESQMLCVEVFGGGAWPAAPPRDRRIASYLALSG
jgi:hypothetical protein